MHHPDYPLNLPLTLARLWAYAGDAYTLIPQLVSGGAALLLLTLLTLGAAVLRGAWVGLAAGGTLAATHTVARLSGWQYADLPTACYMLAAALVACLCLEKKLSRPTSLALVGVLGLGAAWTKNEGLAFAALLLPAVAALSVQRMDWRDITKRWAWLLAGAAVVAWALLVLKVGLAERTTDLFTDRSGAEVWGLATDPARHAQVWRATVGLARDMGVIWPVMLWLLVVGVGYRRRDPLTPGRWRSVLLLLAVVLGQCVVVHMVYVTTHAPLSWHLRTSHTRLFVQVWPVMVLLLAVMSTPPRWPTRAVKPAPARDAPTDISD